MAFRRWQKILAPLLISVLLLVSACGGSTTPNPGYEQAQKESTSRQGQRETKQQNKQKVSGGEFNKFFPQSGGGFDRVFTQEQQGFAQAKMKKDGQEVATLSINDVVSDPSAVQKFQNATQKIGGYPVMQKGNNATELLVNNRFKVQVSSKTLSQSDREAWLQKFDLNGLAKVK